MDFIRWFGLCLACLFASCETDQVVQSTGHALPSAMDEGHFNVLVETSAGEHLVRSYQDSTGHIDSSSVLGFLPMPINFGFIPSYSLPDSHLIKVPAWVFSHRIETGEVVPTIPLGTLNFVENGEEMDHFIMIPVDEKLRFMEASSFDDFAIRYDGIKYAFEYWFRNKEGVGHISRLRWKDDKIAAEQLVDRINISGE